MEQAKCRRRAYGTHIKSVAEFNESWGAEIRSGAEIAKMGVTNSRSPNTLNMWQREECAYLTLVKLTTVAEMLIADADS